MATGGVPPAPTATLAGLAAALAALVPPVRLEVAPALPSTNATLIDRARAGDASACLLMARKQTAGRGRLGRRWCSAEGESLTFSLALALPLAPANWSGLSLAVGLALGDALDPPQPGQPPRLLLKWPNDLLLRDNAAAGPGRKLGGILIETVAVAPQLRLAVIGVGLNLVAPLVDDAAYGVAGLRELDPAASVDGTLARLALPLVAAVHRFAHEGFAPLQAAWQARDALAGRMVATTLPDCPQGLADGVDADGALRLIDRAAPGGPVRRVTAGEVSIRPAAPARAGA
jgi:BirA family biotin operon repressor/biotin-[acetyl-CoA-carboxylase] ligase